MAGDTAGFGEAGAAAAASGANGVTGGNLLITGKSGTAVTTVIGAGASAASAADSINAKSDETGVTADARTQAQLSGFTAGQMSFELNGSVISANAETNDDFASIATAINEKSGSTGVSASVTDSGVVLTDESGKDIKIDSYLSATGDMDVNGMEYDGTLGGTTTTLTGATATTDSTTIGGSVRLNSTATFSVTAPDATVAGAAGTETSAAINVDKVDLATQDGAQSALSIIDGAIAQIDAQRADLGAIQNRFGHTISNLSNIQENVSASRSRIQDTDFAVETANLTKNQILQQAGTSILAQSNQLPQAALSLIG